MKTISGYGALGKETANRMIENVVGTFPLPLGFAPNFQINDKDYIVPMAVEEPSVVAAVINGIKCFNQSGGIAASNDHNNMMSGHILIFKNGIPFEKIKYTTYSWVRWKK